MMVGPNQLHDTDGICLHCGDGLVTKNNPWTGETYDSPACDNCSWNGTCHECGDRIDPHIEFDNACSVSHYQALMEATL